MTASALVRSCAAMALVSLCIDANAQAYSFTDLGPATFAYSINDAGQVVGASGGNATLWNGTRAISLGPGVAFDINDRSVIVGRGAENQPTVWRRRMPVVLPPPIPGAQSGWAYGINDFGRIVGSSNYFDRDSAVVWSRRGVPTILPPVPPVPGQPFNPSIISAAAINNRGLVVGGAYQIGPQNAATVDSILTCWGDYGNQTATMWQGTTGTVLDTPAGGCSQALDVNDSGQIVGGRTIGPRESPGHATVWEGDTYIDLGTLGGENSVALGINNLGQIVGASDIDPDLSNDVVHATLWSDGLIIDLNTYLDEGLLDAGWYLGTAREINDKGWITGEIVNSLTSEVHAYKLTFAPGATAVVIASAVPEPASAALCLVGLGLLLIATRKPAAARRMGSRIPGAV